MKKKPWEMIKGLIEFDDIKIIPYGEIINNMPAWRMTRKDYISIPRMKGIGIQRRDKSLWSHQHRQSVKQALSEGKAIPVSVLKDYPDLLEIK